MTVSFRLFCRTGRGRGWSFFVILSFCILVILLGEPEYQQRAHLRQYIILIDIKINFTKQRVHLLLQFLSSATRNWFFLHLLMCNLSNHWYVLIRRAHNSMAKCGDPMLKFCFNWTFYISIRHLGETMSNSIKNHMPHVIHKHTQTLDNGSCDIIKNGKHVDWRG